MDAAEPPMQAPARHQPPAQEEDEALDRVTDLPTLSLHEDHAPAAERTDDKGERQRDDTTTMVDEVLVPYTFGRTPSLRLDERPDRSSLATQAQQATSSSRPRLEGQRSNSYSSIGSSAGAPSISTTQHHAPPRPYTLPPGLANSPQPAAPPPPLASPGLASYSPTGPIRPAVAPRPTAQPFPRTATTAPGASGPRSARIAYEPPIPLDVQILLLTTPPPPPSASATALAHAAGAGTTGPATLARGETQAHRDELLAAERARRAREDKRLAGKARRLLSGGVNYLSGGGGRRADELAALSPRGAAEEEANTLRGLETLDLNRSQRRTRESRRANGRIDSKTPAEHVPKTWRDYEAAYAAGQLDVEDPPFPPLGVLSGVSTTFPSAQHHRNGRDTASLSPYEAAHFPAPLHLSSITPIRERLIAQLDLLGETYVLPAPTASAIPLHVSTNGSPVSSLPSAGSSVTSGQRDSLVQSLNGPAGGRRASNASTAPSTTHSHASPMQQQKGSSAAVFPSYGMHPSAVASAAMMVSPQPYGVTSVDAISALTLRNHPALVNLLRRALYAPLGSQALFKPAPKAAMVTLFPTSASSSVTILASLNLPTRTASLPISHALDAHVLLAGERGLVIPDTERDWRFRGNDVVCRSPSNPMGAPYGASGLGIRFFAGVPIFAPSLPSLAGFEEEAGGRIAIGTVSLLDDWPRTTKFGSSDRANLRSLASQITHEIDRFLREREQHRFARRSSVSSTVASASVPPSSNGHSAASQATPRTSRARKVASVNGARPQEGGYVDWDAAYARRGSTSDADREHGPTAPAPTTPLPAPPPSTAAAQNHTTLPSPVADTPSSSTFAAACTSLAQSLDLSLVYLVSLDLSSCPPAPSITGQPALTLIAAHNLPLDSSASFDPALHLRALRAPEGGLLYRSPEHVKGGFAGGILLPVAESEDKGWVLAGYTTERARKWGEREMAEFDHVRDGLAKVVAWKDSLRGDPGQA